MEDGDFIRFAMYAERHEFVSPSTSNASGLSFFNTSSVFLLYHQLNSPRDEVSTFKK